LRHRGPGAVPAQQFAAVLARNSSGLCVLTIARLNTTPVASMLADSRSWDDLWSPANKLVRRLRGLLIVAWGNAPGSLRNNHHLAEGHSQRDATTHLNMVVGQTVEKTPDLRRRSRNLT
jgi:hypothetical protein